MFKFKAISVFIFILFTCNAVAEDVYITGGDSAALQTAVDAANVPGSQVTIHLEAGQVFNGVHGFSTFSGNMTIEGNGAIWHLITGGLGTVTPEGSVSLTGITVVNPTVLSIGCWIIRNQGSLTLERVTFADSEISIPHRWTSCLGYQRQLVVNDGSAKLVNVTFAGTKFQSPGLSVIHTSANATTEITHLTVADNTTQYETGDWHNSILLTDPGGSTSISNSIILANSNQEENLVPCEGLVTDNGGNFASPGDCGFSGGVIDRSSLGQIIEKGHDAWVMPLLPDSVAVNAGNPDYCEKLDGRGFERDTLCDSGAYEVAASNHGGELGRGGISGFYYTPESDGNYIQVQRAYDGNVVVIWNTFDKFGTQAWINAIGSYQDGVITAQAYRNLGGVFQPGSGASGGTETEWGTLRVTPHNCMQITVEYESSDPEFGSGSFEAERIAYVHDLGCSEN